MLLIEFVPLLDAEIDRLERARDLLSRYTPAENLSCADEQAADEESTHSAPAQLLLPALATAQTKDAARNEDASSATQAEPPRVTVLKPHRAGRERTPRKRFVVPQDTALRSMVPVGPVAVSAADVRRTQEEKAHKPAPEPPLILDWRSPSAQAREVDAVLKKLLNLGNTEPIAEVAEKAPLARV